MRRAVKHSSEIFWWWPSTFLVPTWHYAMHVFLFDANKLRARVWRSCRRRIKTCSGCKNIHGVKSPHCIPSDLHSRRSHVSQRYWANNSLCQSAATSEIVKALLIASLSGAITSVLIFTFTFNTRFFSPNVLYWILSKSCAWISIYNHRA